MSGTLTVPDVDTRDLDFDLTCEVDEIVYGQHKNPCGNPAVWIGIPPCGHEGLFCEQHHSDQRSFICMKCRNKTLLATYQWMRL